MTTHSPQVLSSVENHQVRHIVDGRLDDQPVFVEGRDTNAILREHMATDDRDPRGAAQLDQLHRLIDDGQVDAARALIAEMKDQHWGPHDPALIRAERLVSDAESEVEAEAGSDD